MKITFLQLTLILSLLGSAIAKDGKAQAILETLFAHHCYYHLEIGYQVVESGSPTHQLRSDC